MSKLKTLRDLKEHFEEYYDEQVINNKHSFIPERAKVLKSDLKDEVVKWVKDIQFRYETQDKVTFAGNWIMHFFNLTESDLKELKGVKK